MTSSINILQKLYQIEVEDLQYVERDLCFYELVSLGFLLYGEERVSAEFILQKLIVLSQNPPNGRATSQQQQRQGVNVRNTTSDILTKYASLNAKNWRECIVEALAIIRAKKVLRKLGLCWQDVHTYFLPHIAELSLNIHPLLKALYKICERLTSTQAGRLVQQLNEQHLPEETQSLRFYDFSYFEVFLLNWMNKRLLTVGDINLNGANVEILIEYFKFNEMEAMSTLLKDTIMHNLDAAATLNKAKNTTISTLLSNIQQEDKNMVPNISAAAGGAEDIASPNHSDDSGACMSSGMVNSKEQHNFEERSSKLNEIANSHKLKANELDFNERYQVRKEHAGYVLIINQSKFHEESNADLKNLLPNNKFKKHREGTDVDRDALEKLFKPFGYVPIVFNNLDHIQMQHHIRETVKKTMLKDSLIVCILSHGKKGYVYGCNSIPVAISDIEDIMADKNLKGKPKFLVIQACQNDDSKKETKNNNNNSNNNIPYPRKANDYADMLIGMSSIAGTEALRNTETGSWFISSLCQQIEKWENRKHLLDILTCVTRDVANKKTTKNDLMLPISNTTLRKEFYLPSQVL